MIPAVLTCVSAALLGHATGRGLAHANAERANHGPTRPLAPFLAVLAVLGALAAGGGLAHLALAPDDLASRLVATLAGWLAALGTAQGLGLDLAWGRAPVRHVTLGATLGGLGAFAVLLLVHADMLGTHQEPLLAEFARADGATRAGLALYVTLVAPALEEAVMRGAVQGQLARVAPRAAIVASALLFAALHPGTWPERAPIVGLGLLAAGLRVHTGRVLPAVAVHVAWNAVVCALA